MLDHYRLKVPAIRSVLEYMKYVIVSLDKRNSLKYELNSFLALFVLFVLTLELAELNKVNVIEIIFMVYALGTS